MNDDADSEDRATTAKLAYQLKESAGREGVYYVLRFPARWRLYAFPWDDFGDLWHGDVWRRFVVSDLAEAWAGSAKVTADQLKPLWKGSPAGELNVSAFKNTQFIMQTIFQKPGSRASASSGPLSWPAAKCFGPWTPMNSRIRSIRRC